MQLYSSRYSGLLSVAVVLLLAACGRPIADFAISGDTKAPAKISFQNQSQKAVSYRWDFGDGSVSEEETPQYRYRNSGQYTVKLQAVNAKNKKRSKTMQLNILPPDRCLVEIQTSYGTMIAELYDATPRHQDNFIKLADQGFFDSLLFHRVIEGFMIQGGDPSSKQAKAGQALGSGGPGYTVPAELIDTLVHLRGALAAARLGDQANPSKSSSGSQFYIVHGKAVGEAELKQVESRKRFRYTPDQRKAYETVGGTPFLDGEYTVFGRVIEGMEVIDAIAAVKKGGQDRPESDVRMFIRVIR